MSHQSTTIMMTVVTPALFVSAVSICAAADWPEWRGAGRTGVWMETGVLDHFPSEGLKVRWRTPVRAGYSGPAVSGGRVFIIDYEPGSKAAGVERALALDEQSGKVLWTREWNADYSGVSYAVGPRATPTVDGDRVYFLGGRGALVCLDAASGAVRWRRDYVSDYRAEVPIWGMASAPIVHDNRLFALVGGSGGARVVAFDKFSGKELWRALEGTSEPGYSAPIVIERAGRPQIIQWMPESVVALNPGDGEILWRHPYRTRMGLVVATPVQSGAKLFVSSFYNGSMLLELNDNTAREVWRGKSDSEIQTEGLHALISTPVIDRDHVYGICSYGQLRCLRLETGERVWETQSVTGERARWATAFIVRNQGRYFINNDRGELIIARFTPAGYHEEARTKLIDPTTTEGIGRRKAGAINWSHPAYANRHIVARNDREIIRASLEK